MQVARAYRAPFDNARQVDFLAQTGTPARRSAVRREHSRPHQRAPRSGETAEASTFVGAAVPRVAIAQRRNFSLFDLPPERDDPENRLARNGLAADGP